MSFYHDKRRDVWLPVFSGRKNSTYIINPTDQSKRYLSIAQESCKDYCDGNCPLCLPPMEQQKNSKTPKQTKRPHGPIKVKRYDSLLMAKEGDECLGLFSTVLKEALIFPVPKQVPDGDFLRKMPHVKIWEGVEVTGGAGEVKYVAGKFVVRFGVLEKDWQKIWQRISLILCHNILSTSSAGGGTVTYRFGTFPLASVAAFCDRQPDRLLPQTDPDQYVLYQGLH